MRRKIMLKTLILTLVLSLAWMPIHDTPVQAAEKESAEEVPAPKLSAKKVTISEGKSKKLRVKNLPEGTSVKWSSSDKKIAAVTKTGKVKAKKTGKCTITANVGKITLTCKVTVKAVTDTPSWDGKDNGTVTVDDILFPTDKGWTENYISTDSASYTSTSASAAYTYGVSGLGAGGSALLSKEEEQEAFETLITDKINGAEQESRTLLENREYTCIIILKLNGEEDTERKVSLLLMARDDKLITVIKVGRSENPTEELTKLSSLIDTLNAKGSSTDDAGKEDA